MKKFIFLMLTIVLSLGLLSCGSDKSAPNESYAADTSEEAVQQELYKNDLENPEDSPAEEGVTEGVGSENSSILDTSNVDYIQSKIIRNASISIKTKSYDNTIKLIEEVVSSSGGYVEQSELEGTMPETAYDYGRSGTLILRVPAKSFDSSLKKLRKGGEVISESLSTENVSAAYRDTQARIESLNIQIQSLDKLMAKADKVEDMIKLENEISRLRYEKETLEGGLRKWDDLISFSSITISINEVNTINPTFDKSADEGEMSFSEEAKYSFVSAWYDFIGFLKTFAIWLLSAWPALLILLIIIIAVLIIYKKRRKNKQRGNNYRKYDSPLPFSSIINKERDENSSSENNDEF